MFEVKKLWAHELFKDVEIPKFENDTERWSQNIITSSLVDEKWSNEFGGY